MAKAKGDQRKALHALLFVVAHLPKLANVYNVLKCPYYADRKHLQEYGRQICGETFYALEHGPAPSAAYEIVKDANGRAKRDLRFPEALESPAEAIVSAMDESAGTPPALNAAAVVVLAGDAARKVV